MSMSSIKISVNHNRCVGSKLCIQFSPGVFALNENGQSAVINPEGDELMNILSTAEQCPQCAIRVEDMTTGDVLFPPPELDF